MSVNSEIQKLLLKGDLLNEAQIRRYEKLLIQLYLNALRKIKLELADIYSNENIKYADLRGARLQSLQSQIEKELNKLKDSKEVIKDSILNGKQLGYTYTGFALERTLQTDIGFSLLPQSELKAALYNPYDKIKWSTRNLANIEQMKNKVRKAVTQGLIDGKGYGHTAKLLSKELNVGVSKAVRIVHTETGRAQEAGRIASIDKSKEYADGIGMKTVKVWNATLDDKTRENHGNMDGKEADGTGKFLFTTMDGDTIYVDGPHLTNTTDDINCRCYTSLKFENIPLQVRKDNMTKEVIPYTTYNEWKKAKGL